jgi:hypothetical protein
MTFPQKLLDTALRIPPHILNDAAAVERQAGGDALDVRLKRIISRIKAEAVELDSGQVDYARLKHSPVYQDYRQTAALLPEYDLQSLVHREQRLAFWLNLYNALVIDGIIHYGIQRTVNEVTGFFRRAAYAVGGYRFNLDDIEHGILRANAGHPFIPGPQFGPHDPRRRYALDQPDIRVHFALVCGAVSCPPVNFYDAEKIDAQLDMAARNFLSQTVEIDREGSSIRLSRLLQWYAEDFGAGAWAKVGVGDRRPLLRAIAPYLVEEQRVFLEAAPGNLKVRFNPYNWGLNTLQAAGEGTR